MHVVGRISNMIRLEIKFTMAGASACDRESSWLIHRKLLKASIIQGPHTAAWVGITQFSSQKKKLYLKYNRSVGTAGVQREY